MLLSFRQKFVTVCFSFDFYLLKCCATFEVFVVVVLAVTVVIIVILFVFVSSVHS